MPSRSPKMNRRIFGFQRRVWWPKCTPASSRSRRSTWMSVAIEAPWVGLCGCARPAPSRTRRDAPGRTRGLSGRGRRGQERVSVEAMELHPLARDGFADVADHYERGRPDYPAEAVRLLGLPRGARVLDLAGGTGKLTRVLRAEGLDVIPVEPLASMRARVDGALEGTAEAIPLDGASVDAV